MWIFYGLLAATSFGIAAIFQKLAARPGSALSSAWEVLVFQGIATVAIGLLGVLITKQAFSMKEKDAYMWALLTGTALAIGALFIFMTYTTAKDTNADASRIQALINTNTLIAVILGLLVLKEYTHLHTVGDWTRLILGAVLVVAGGILVSMPPKANSEAAKSHHTYVVHSHATHAHPHHKHVANRQVPLLPNPKN